MNQHKRRTQPLLHGFARQLGDVRAQHTAGNHAAAEQSLIRLRAQRPDDPALLSVYGCFLKDVGRPLEAAPLLERLVELAPDSASHWLDLGSAHQDSGRFDRALQAYSRAIALDPARWEVYLNLAFLLEARADYTQAEKYYRYAIKLKPDCLAAWSGLGEMCLYLRQPEQAIACFHEALTLAPSAQLYCNLAQSQILCRQFEAAVETARKAIAINPNIAMAHAHEARALLFRSRFVEAMKACERALQVDAGCTSAMVALANTHGYLCNREEAVFWFMRAIESCRDSNQHQVHSSMFFTLTNTSTLEPERVLEEHERWAQLYGPPVVEAIARWRNRPADDPDRKLRVGFVS